MVDGVYVFDDAYDDLIQIDNLSWENRENNTNEFSFGIPFEYFGGLTSMTVASQSGSLNEDGPDIVPNEGMVELFLVYHGFLSTGRGNNFRRFCL